jgi:tetratricopeptide (TPR) repeat protein
MPTIEIRQTATTETGFNATVTIANAEFAITVRDPFERSEERELEWYFEQWIKFPFSDGTIAQRAAQSVRAYGENLFEQVFAGRVYGAYQKVNERLSELELVIAGDPEFQGLHWEAMWDRDFQRPLAIDCLMVRQRRIRGMVNGGRVQESAVLNLLVVTARPNEENDVGYRTISRPLVEAIRDARLRVNVEIVRPGTYEAFVRHVEEKPEGFYHVVHFDLHGGVMTYEQFQKYDRRSGNYTFQRGYGLAELAAYPGVKAFLFFEGAATGQAVPVTADEMAQRLQGRGIPICMLNACQSGKQVPVAEPDTEPGVAMPDDRETSLGARLMDAGMQLVVAMGYSVTVDAAKLLMGRVYGELFAGRGLPEALRLGRRSLFDQKGRSVYFNQRVDLEDWLLPVVYGNGGVDLRLRAMTGAEESEYFTQQATGYRFGGATYGFVGRDLDILKLEKLLLRHGVVLVQGMGGTGKTTLLRYLQDWWVQTNFVEGAVYFGYDTKAWTLEQMMFEIARSLFSEGDCRSFLALPSIAQVGKLVQELRSRRLGLMLDNLESVTGQALAIPNTLPEEERAKIGDFLERIAGGKTIVLLGSRGREEWLRSSFTRDGIEFRYELRGLDGEARSLLAKKVLERHVPDGERRRTIADREFGRLQGLLAGYPLAIEVVLANLGRQSVAEVWAGLEGADVSLDRVGGRTESILKCVEYSHSNLSVGAQKLLLCLAPFSGFIDRSDLGNYAEQLQKLEPFRDYPFEQFDEAVGEAIAWGLLAPFENNPGLLSIQPVFPYFLKTKLAQEDEATREALRTGFKQHYLGLAGSYGQLMKSKDAQERQLGIFFCRLEYENLYSALQVCLARQETIGIFFCLNTYLRLTNDVQSNLKLAEFVCEQLESYAPQFLQGEQGYQISFALERLGNCYLTVQSYTQARQQYEKALKVYEVLDSIEERQKQLWMATDYHQLGRVAQELREFEQARADYQQALQIKVEFNDRYEQASTYHQLGKVAQDLREFEQARADYQQALQIYVEFDDRYEQASTYHNLGKVAQDLREFEQARADYQQALQIFVEFNDRYSQAYTHHNLGIVAQKLCEFEQARADYQQALQIKVEFGDRYSQASTYHQLGIVAQDLREFEQARADYQHALQIFIEFGDRYSQASTYHNLGMVAQDLREFEQARADYQRALQIKVEFGDRHSQANTHHQLGLLAEAEGNLVEARAALQQAMAIFTEFGDEYGMAIVQRNLDRLSG